MSTNYCNECGDATDNGEGWDSLCGNCADAAVNSRDKEIESMLKIEAQHKMHEAIDKHMLRRWSDMAERDRLEAERKKADDTEGGDCD